jgi:hypothetical protein
MNKLADQLIVCTGIRINPECTLAIADLGNGWHGNNPRFVMSEWMSEDQFRQAILLWIVDDSVPWGDVRFALSQRIPLLVPDTNAPMKQLCASANCGLWYRDEIDLRLCLESILADDALREHMGASGQLYAASGGWLCLYHHPGTGLLPDRDAAP